MKQKSIFICQSCGNEAPKWAGKCSFCGEWNSLVETASLTRSGQKTGSRRKKLADPQKLSEVKKTNLARIKTGLSEIDRVLGAGVVPGSVILLAGEPGIGKSTLVLQLAAAISGQRSVTSDQPLATSDRRPVIRKKNKKPITDHRLPITLYISGEESLSQIKIRADRLGAEKSETLFLSEIEVETICDQIEKIKPKIAIIDSIQTLVSEDLSGPAGSVGQVREAAMRLIRVAKTTQTALFLIGHVTKGGIIAGPKVLEHMVDVVVTLEGEKLANFRILRSVKNRFGATSEVGIFEMTDRGMKEVTNPSKVLLEKRVEKTPGSVVVPVIEGTRPILAEIQALVVPTQLPIPRRVVQGISYNRVQLVAAVLTKKLGLPLGGQDVMVNVAGGLKIEDPGADLGVALAIYSSFKDISLPVGWAVFGEVGLLGELRSVFQGDRRIKEAKRLGFTKVISPEKFSSVREVVSQIKLQAS